MGGRSCWLVLSACSARQQGKQTHDDLKASQADHTLEHALLAGANACSEPDCQYRLATRVPGTAKKQGEHGTRGGWRSETRAERLDMSGCEGDSREAPRGAR